MSSSLEAGIGVYRAGAEETCKYYAKRNYRSEVSKIVRNILELQSRSFQKFRMFNELDESPRRFADVDQTAQNILS